MKANIRNEKVNYWHSYRVDGVAHYSDGVLFGRVTYELFESYWPFVAANASGGPPPRSTSHTILVLSASM